MGRWNLAAAGWLLGGVVWLITGWMGLNAVDGTGGFYATETSWLVVHLLVLVGLVGLVRVDAVGGISWGRKALIVAVIGRLLFELAEIVAIIVGKDEIALFPLAVLLTATGMLIGGVAVVRARKWRGLARFTPLAMGAFPFVAIFPFFAATGERPNPSVVLWGVTLVGIGWAMLSNGGAARPPDRSGVNDDVLLAASRYDVHMTR